MAENFCLIRNSMRPTLGASRSSRLRGDMYMMFLKMNNILFRVEAKKAWRRYELRVNRKQI